MNITLRPASKISRVVDALSPDEAGAGGMMKSKISSHLAFERPEHQDCMDVMPLPCMKGTPGLGESECRESVLVDKVDRVVEPVCFRKHSATDSEDNGVQEACWASRRDGRKHDKKEFEADRYERTEVSRSARRFVKSDEPIRTVHCNREHEQANLKVSGVSAKSLKNLSWSLKPTVKTRVKGLKDAEHEMGKGRLEAYRELAKAYQDDMHAGNFETKRVQAETAAGDQKGMICGSYGMVSQILEGKTSGYEGSDVILDKLLTDSSKVCRRTSGPEQEEIVATDPVQQFKKDGFSGRGLLAQPGMAEGNSVKDVQAGSVRKCKAPALMENPVVKPRGKDLQSVSSKQILNDRSFSESRDELKLAQSTDDVVRKLSLNHDAKLESCKQRSVVPAVNGVYEVVTDRVRRDAITTTGREFAKESKVRKRGSKEQASITSGEKEACGSQRELWKETGNSAALDSSNKASSTAEQLFQPSITVEADAGFPALSNAVVVHEDWVLCDTCSKWRLCVPWIKVDELPKKWRCKMMTWL